MTLLLDGETFAVLDELRRRHFPPERNFLPAHVTLFHALPAAEENLIGDTLEEICARTKVLALRLSRLRFLGKGVAVEVDCPELITFRKELAGAWGEFLSAQDGQKFRPHVTVQNKVAPNDAKILHHRMEKEWRPLAGRGEGVLWWRYAGGPWEFVREIRFAR